MPTPLDAPVAATGLSSYQKFIVALIAFLQFTIILDFLVLSPLGALVMPALSITPAQFGLVVSTYAFSASLSGLLSAGFNDRFDRRKLLLFFYGGFVLGTLLCALARSYHFLLFARIVTGVFGGVIGSIVFAITTDLFDYRVRGRVLGVVQTAFAVCQVLGLPFALLLSNRWGWNAPFLLIVAVSSAVGVLIILYMRPVDAHLRLHPDRSPLHHFLHTVSTPRYLQGFVTTGLLTVGGYMILPFASAFTVHNLGIDIERLPLIYTVTGLCSAIAGPLIGRAADTLGKFRIFAFGCGLAVTAVLIFTHLGVTPLSVVILINVLMFIGVSSRMISASAMISAIPLPADRGSYMSVSSSLQQFSGGIAAAVAGLIVMQRSDGSLLHFDRIGYVLAVSTLISLSMMYRIQRRIEAGEPAAATAAANTGP